MAIIYEWKGTTKTATVLVTNSLSRPIDVKVHLKVQNFSEQVATLTVPANGSNTASWAYTFNSVGTFTAAGTVRDAKTDSIILQAITSAQQLTIEEPSVTAEATWVD